MDGPRSGLGRVADFFLDDPSTFTVLCRVSGLVVVLAVILAAVLDFVLLGPGGLVLPPELYVAGLALGVLIPLLPVWPAPSLVPFPVQSESWLATAARVLGVGILAGTGLGFAADLLLLGSPDADIPVVVYGLGVVLGVNLVISPAFPVFFPDDW